MPLPISLFILLALPSVFCSMVPNVSAQPSGARPYAGIVNGDTIWLDEFSREVGRRAEMYGQVESMTQSDIVEQSWNEIVVAILLRQQAKKLEVTLTDDEIDSVLLTATPDFVKRGVVDEKGRFDGALLASMVLNPDSLVKARGQNLSQQERKDQLSQLKASIAELRSRVGHLTMLQRLRELITKQMTVDTALLRERFALLSTTANAELIYFPCPAIPNEPMLSELEAYYKAHSDRYTTTQKMRRVAVLAWPLIAASIDSSLFLNNINSWINLVNNARSRRERDSVWDDVASTIASGTTTLHPDSATHKQFYDACSGKKSGTAVGPFVLASGVHVLLIDSVFTVKGSKGKHVAVRVAITDIPPSKETIDSTLREVEVAEDMYARGTILGELATKFRKHIELSPFFTPDTKIYDSYRLVDAAFETQVGAATNPIDASDRGIVLAVIVDSVAPGPLPFEAAAERVRADMKRELSCKSIESTVRSYAGIVVVLEDGRMLIPEAPKEATILRDITVTMDGTIGESIIDTLAGRAICAATSSGMMEPFRGNAGWYIVNVKNVNKSPDNEFPLFMMSSGEELIEEQRTAYWEKWKSELVSNSKIEDRRSVYFRY